MLLHFIEPDNQVVRMTWNRMMDVYSEMLMVFVRILQESAEPSAAAALEQDLRDWWTKAAEITSNRQLS